MGYYTNYRLKTDPPLPDVSVSDDYEISTDSKGRAHSVGIKWYDHELEMVDASKNHPDTLFVLDGWGEEDGDVWRKYFQRGLVQIWRLKIPNNLDLDGIAEPFNEAALKETDC